MRFLRSRAPVLRCCLFTALLLLFSPAATTGEDDSESAGKPCRLMIVAAGFPRTGSTAQMLLLGSALQQLNVSVSNLGFHKYHLHARLDADASAAYKEKIRGLRAAWKSDTVVLLKTHQFDGKLLVTCERSLVFTSTMDQERGIEDTMASICAAGWIDCTEDGVTHFARYFEDALRAHRKWMAHSTLNIEKSGMRSPFAFLAVCSSIAAALQLEELPPSACLPSQAWMEARHAEANPNIPHKQKMESEESRAWARAVLKEGRRLRLPILQQMRAV